MTLSRKIIVGVSIGGLAAIIWWWTTSPVNWKWTDRTHSPIVFEQNRAAVITGTTTTINLNNANSSSMFTRLAPGRGIGPKMVSLRRPWRRVAKAAVKGEKILATRNLPDLSLTKSISSVPTISPTLTESIFSTPTISPTFQTPSITSTVPSTTDMTVTEGIIAAAPDVSAPSSMATELTIHPYVATDILSVPLTFSIPSSFIPPLASITSPISLVATPVAIVTPLPEEHHITSLAASSRPVVAAIISPTSSVSIAATTSSADKKITLADNNEPLLGGDQSNSSDNENNFEDVDSDIAPVEDEVTSGNDDSNDIDDIDDTNDNNDIEDIHESVSSTQATSMTSTIKITPTTTTVPVVKKAPPRVVINEIAWAGTASYFPQDQWLEIYNTTNETIDFKKWTIVVSGQPLSFDKVNNAILDPHGYLLLTRGKQEVIKNVSVDIVFGAAVSFSKKGDRVQLLSPDGVLVDEVDASHGWFAGDTVLARTMERVDSLRDGNDPHNWQSNHGPRLGARTYNGGLIYGTPRASNHGLVSLTGRQDEMRRVLTPTDNPYVLEFYEIPAGYTLVIEPGVVIKAAHQQSKIDVLGKLIIKGTSGQPVVLTSGRDHSFSEQRWNTIIGNWEKPDPQSKDWQGLVFSPGSSGELTHAVIKYAGHLFYPDSYIYTPPVSQAIRAIGAQLTIDHCVFESNGDLVAYLKNSTTTIKNSDFAVGDRAVEARNTHLVAEKVRFDRFTNPEGPLFVRDIWPVLKNLIFTHDIFSLPYLENVVIRGAVYLQFPTSLFVTSLSIEVSSSLHVAAGTTIYLGHYGSIDVNGTLDARGTEEAPVRFLSLDNTKLWGYIRFNHSTSTLSHVIMRGGSQSNAADTAGMIVANFSRLIIDHCVLSNIHDPGNIILAFNSFISVNSCLINQSTHPLLSVNGVKATGGHLEIVGTVFEHLSRVLISMGLPAPTIDIRGITRDNLRSIDILSEPLKLLDSWIDKK